MDAVRLANAWNGRILWRNSEAVDDGFGRKVGYHSFRSHPLLTVCTAAHVWHGHEDNICRVLIG